MNVERLLEVVNLLRRELDHHRPYEPLSELKKAVEQEHSGRIEAAKQKLFEMLDGVSSNFLSPSRRMIVKQIGAEKLVGKGLEERVRALLDDYRLSLREIAAIIAQISGEILNFHGYLNNFSNFSKYLGVTEHALSNGECEIGVIYPKVMVVDLASVVKEGSDLDSALRVFMEIGGTSGSPSLRQISSSELAVYLAVAAGVAAAVAGAVERIMDLIKKKYEIEKLRLEIEEKRIDHEAAARLKERENAVVERGLDQAAEDLMALYGGGDEGRRNELRIAARRSMDFLLCQIRFGVIFEVVASSKTSDGQSVEEVQGGDGISSLEARNLALVQKVGGAMREIVAKQDQLALLGPDGTEDK